MHRITPPSWLFLLALAGCLLHVACGADDSRPDRPSRSADGVLWRADGSEPIHREWASYAAADSCWARGTALTTPGRLSPRIHRTSRVAPPGRDRSYVFKLVDGDECSGERAEVGQGNPVKPALSERVFHEGDDVWIGYQLLVPNSVTARVPTWQCLGQFKAAGRGGPVLCAALTDYRLSIQHATSIEQSSVGLRPLWVASRPVQRKRWLRYLFHIRFSQDPRKGLVEFWADLADGGGLRLRIPRTHLFTMKTGGPATVHPRIGIYRDEDAAGDARAYFAGYTVGTKRKAVEALAFGR